MGILESHALYIKQIGWVKKSEENRSVLDRFLKKAGITFRFLYWSDLSYVLYVTSDGVACRVIVFLKVRVVNCVIVSTQRNNIIIEHLISIYTYQDMYHNFYLI